METEHPEPVHPANAEELANIAEETGADVLRGPLRYPSYSGGWQLGDLDLSEYLAKYRDHEVVVIVASVGKAGQGEREKYVCGVCGFALDEVGECPRCRWQNEEIAKGLEKRAFLREVDEFVKGKWEDADNVADRS